MLFANVLCVMFAESLFRECLEASGLAGGGGGSGGGNCQHSSPSLHRGVTVIPSSVGVSFLPHIWSQLPAGCGSGKDPMTS